MTDPGPAFIHLIGTLLELSGAILLGALFLVLRSYAGRRTYFYYWAGAWPALTVAVAAFAGRTVLESDLQHDESLLAVLAFLHGFFQLAFFALLVAGTASYVRSTVQRPFLAFAAISAAVYTAVAVTSSLTITEMIRWQTPLAVVTLGWCATRLLSLPPARLGIGIRATGFVFLVLGLLWAGYLITFSLAPPFGAYTGHAVPTILFGYHTYFNTLLHMLLGFGMIITLMEDAWREVADAHAELKLAHHDLRREALYDAVTGTLNRRAFAEGLGLESARSQCGAVMMIDVDDLKSVNDVHGHSAGDTLLRQLADSLRDQIRPSDRLYRWGGDEFLLLLPGADVRRAESRLRRVIQRARKVNVAPGVRVGLSVSMGSARYASGDGLPLAIERADALMYEDKARRKSSRGASGQGAH